ncbi:F-box/kelch-repeat protein At5g43190 [Linum grandiflorum]
MDPGIWSRLPVEILDNILSLLPLKTFMTLRSTCRHFDSLIYSPFFISKHSSSYSSSSFLLLSHPQFPSKLGLYDSATATWGASPSSSSSTLLASSNGLFCLSLPGSSSFLISNFLTKSSRPIKFPILPFEFDSLTLISSKSGGYKIFAYSTNYSFIYDSAAQSWFQFEGFSASLCRQGGVTFNGSIYFTTEEPFKIVGFDMSCGKWGRVAVEMPEEGMSFARVVSDTEEGERKLYLVGGVGENGISKTVKLWELVGGKWVEIERVPEMMCRKFVSVCYHNYEHVYCFWHQGMICICCYTWPEILYYKVGRRSWHWLPKCPSLTDKWSCGFRWFSFLPQLHALV